MAQRIYSDIRVSQGDFSFYIMGVACVFITITRSNFWEKQVPILA
jgi:hypothetical protein